ncbi:hypothetical protein Kfla_0761 [Kribbella flavida DSM 17836]|uniref:Uncharacterized protein n=1 Tax=Kribbella flavida (strain DSM 17836 / JCM 10339 / NBRC 14399) TaxID=479435 RepID=D2PYN4_KRIFD|nr:hypothetical protein [Kribbella flavida]ADB29880.1 hypothetical protein Kfla_0761 [Kribbella flavida DSM 17836]
MYGDLIKIFTDQTAHQANLTHAYAERLAVNIRDNENNTAAFETAARGPFALANRSGVDAWASNATTRGPVLVHEQGDGLQTITNHHEANGAYALQQMSSVSMPTA